MLHKFKSKIQNSRIWKWWAAKPFISQTQTPNAEKEVGWKSVEILSWDKLVINQEIQRYIEKGRVSPVFDSYSDAENYARTNNFLNYELQSV